MSIQVTLACRNQGDGYCCIVFERGKHDAQYFIDKEVYKGYDGYESFGHLEDPLDVLTFTDEAQMKSVLGKVIA